MLTQAHIFYSGRVQGVGFRYAVLRYAGDLKLIGFVKNLPNGSVEVVAEGERQLIDQLNESLERHFEGYIKNRNITYRPSSGEFKEFRIVF